MQSTVLEAWFFLSSTYAFAVNAENPISASLHSYRMPGSFGAISGSLCVSSLYSNPFSQASP